MKASKSKIKTEALNVIFSIAAAFISSVTLHIFVVPSNFSPTGIDGLSTILYELTGINIGWYKILINLPLLILAYIFLNKKYAFYVIFFTLLDSIGVIFWEMIDLYTYIPADHIPSEIIAYRLLAALIAGILGGISIGIMLKLGFSSGGVDIIAGLVHKWNPHFNVERIISICSYLIVGISFFVYHDLTSIFLSAIQIFVAECMISTMLKRDRFAVEVKIITKNPDIIKDEILYKHRHSATIIEGCGMYSGENRYMVVSVMNIQAIPSLMTTMQKYPEDFVYFTDGVRVQGDFHFNENEIGGWTSAYK